jgi:hypothetical protein
VRRGTSTNAHNWKFEKIASGEGQIILWQA